MDLVKKLEDFKYEYIFNKIGKCQVLNNYICCSVDIDKLKKYPTYYKFDNSNQSIIIMLDELSKKVNKSIVFLFRSIDFENLNINIVSKDVNVTYNFFDCVFRKNVNIDAFDIQMTNNHYRGLDNSKVINLGGINTTSISIKKQNIIDYSNDKILLTINVNYGNVCIDDSNINVKDLIINNTGKCNLVNINYSNITASRIIINSNSLDTDNSSISTKTFVNNGNKTINNNYGILTFHKKINSFGKHLCKIKVRGN